MARVKSILNIKGSLGDYVFYTLNGKHVVRRKPVKKRGKKSAATEKVKVLNNEFSRVSSCSRLLRDALEPEVEALRNTALHSALMKMLLAVKNEDTADKGMRTVYGGLQTEKGRELFSAFRFQKHRKARPVLRSATRNVSTIELKFLGTLPKDSKILEVQLDVEAGKFRRAEHQLSVPEGSDTIVLKRQLRSRKGFTEFWFLSGEDFMNGVVGEMEK